MNRKNILPGIFILIGIVIIGLLIRNHQVSGPILQNSILTKVQDTKTLRVGYAAYPPYVIKDLKTGELSGYDIDVVKELADQMGVKIVWVETTWQTYISDLQTGKYDIIADAVFTSVPRWEQINFTSPLGYFSSVAGIVKIGDNRFTSLSDLNKKGIIIAVPQGWSANAYATEYLSSATIKAFPGDTPALAFADVLAGNSDVALADGPSVQQYLEQNKNQNVKAVFLNNPSVIVPAGWGVKKGDVEWLTFLNGSIESLRTDGTISAIAKKYHLYSYDLESKFVPQ